MNRKIISPNYIVLYYCGLTTILCMDNMREFGIVHEAEQRKKEFTGYIFNIKIKKDNEAKK